MLWRRLVAGSMLICLALALCLLNGCASSTSGNVVHGAGMPKAVSASEYSTWQSEAKAYSEELTQCLAL